MLVKLKKIGNSKGLIIPKKVLESCEMKDEVILIVEEGQIIISSSTSPREGWEDKFKLAILSEPEHKYDYFDGISNEFDDTEWTW